MNIVKLTQVKKICIGFAALFFLCSSVLAQTPILGAPFISNFNSKIYKAHNQNWAAVQDARGVMYISNSSGILEFDGQRWNLITVKGNSTVRAISIAHDGTIFYGSIGEIGYLAISPNGKVKSVSLNNLIPSDASKFNDVWQIESTKQGVYFFTRTAIYRYHEGKISVLSGKFASSQATVLNDTIFYADIDHGLSLIDGDQIHMIPQLASVYNGNRIALTKFGKHEILAVRVSGDFLRLDVASLWHEKNQKYELNLLNPLKPLTSQNQLTSTQAEEQNFVHPFKTEMDEFLQTEQAYAYKLASSGDNTFAMATIKAGVFSFDRSGKLLRVINKNNGLIDNVVLNIMFDRFNNLWVSTNLGLSHVELSVPQFIFGANNGIDGMVLAAQYYKDRFYVGTFQDTLMQVPFQYSIKDNTPKFVPIKNGGNGVWAFKEVEGDLMAATPEGLYKIEGEQSIKIAGTTKIAYVLETTPKWEKHLFVGVLGGIQIFKRTDNGWVYVSKPKEITSNIRNITTDQYGDLWLVSDSQGLIRMHFNGSSPSDVSVHYFGQKQGLQDVQITRVFFDHSQMYLLTSKGLLKSTLQVWDDKVSKEDDGIVFALDQTYWKNYQESPLGVYDMLPDGKGGYIFATDDGVISLKLDKNGQAQTNTNAFRGLDSPDGAFYGHPQGGIWVPGNGLYRVEVWSDKNYQQSFDALIRKVLVNNKEPLFEGNYGEVGKNMSSEATIFLKHQNAKEIPNIEYVKNALSFEFAATFYEKPGTTLFQYKLNGFDKDWSSWDYVASKEYTNIPEGKYTFQVRAKNVYDKIGQEASYSFVILAPWYRTIWAYLLWIALVCIALVSLIQFYTFRLKREKIILEKMITERTQQLRDATLTDPLTGLRNRRFIGEVLQSDITAFIGYKKYLIESENPRDGMTGKEVFGLFLLDMDHFKQVNDTYGHDAGDQLLKQFSQILTGAVRDDDVVIRLGGEEFLVVLKKTNPEYIHAFANKLLKAVENSEFNLGGGIVIHKTCSIGYTTFPVYSHNPDLISFDQGVMIADMAMYYAKHQGRNQAIFLHEGNDIPTDPESIQKTATSLEFALKNNYLAIGKPPYLDK